MEYFYTPPQCISQDELTIEGDEFAHLTHVMRRKAGDVIRVVDGTGNAFDATIIRLMRRTAFCSIQARHVRLHEPSIDITLGVAVLKNSSRFDFLVEKTTELGATTIVPLLTERTIPHHAKTERWQKLALAAMKQSGRCVLPTVKRLTALQDFLVKQRPDSVLLLPFEEATEPLLRNAIAPLSAAVTLCIGPEGGFSHEETRRAVSAGFALVSLGPRRLRTETAAIVAVADVLGAS